MGLHRQILRDLRSLVIKLRSARFADHGDLADETEMRARAIQDSYGVADAKLLQQRTRVVNELRAYQLAFRKRFGAKDQLATYLDTHVVPYVQAVSEHEDQPQPVSDSDEGTPDEMTGAQFGNWVIGNRFGRGGYGRVYHASNEMTGRRECAKVIAVPDTAADKAEQYKRFMREVRAPAEVGHRSLPTVFDSFYDDARFKAFVIIMEYIRGERLDHWASAKNQDAILDIFEKILDPVGECHQHGIIHRDLKPSNILVTPNNDVKLLDFGLVAAIGASSATLPGQVIGTLRYICPEQLKGLGDPAPTNDIWSLGVILAESCTGIHPFPHDSVSDLLVAIQGGRLPLEGLHDGLSRIIRKCLAAEVPQRYSDTASLWDDLRNYRRPPVARHRTALVNTGSQNSAQFARDGVASPMSPAEFQLPRSNFGQPLLDPIVSPYPLVGGGGYPEPLPPKQQECDYCHTIGQWFGTRCAKCGRYQGVD